MSGFRSSLSKAITDFCVASLIRDDRLRLDDHIGRHLASAFKRYGKPTDGRLAQITVEQLLSHRSGIPRAVAKVEKSNLNGSGGPL